MPGRILYRSRLRTLEPSSASGWTASKRHRLTDDDPKSCATATGSASSDYAIIYDLGIARYCRGAAVVNHNLRALGFTTFTVKTGSTDNGTTWDETPLTVSSLQTSGYTPSFAGVFSGPVTKRYWRFGFQSSVSAADVLSIGQLCLFERYGDLPTAPSAPRQFSGMDTAAIDRGLGGYEARHDVGVGNWRRQLRWKRTLADGLIDYRVRDILRYARGRSEWGFEPVCWVPHDAEKPNPSYDAHPCAYCVFEGVADSEVYQTGSVRRYDVALRLRELTFDGLL